MIGETYTPPMYRDLMSAGMPMYELDPTMMGMGSMYGGGMGIGMGMYNTNYLGGVTLQPKLNRDTFHIMRAKEKENNNNLKKFGIAVLGLFGLGVMRTIFKGKKIPSAGGKHWYNPMTWFKK